MDESCSASSSASIAENNVAWRKRKASILHGWDDDGAVATKDHPGRETARRKKTGTQLVRQSSRLSTSRFPGLKTFLDALGDELRAASSPASDEAAAGAETGLGSGSLLAARKRLSHFTRARIGLPQALPRPVPNGMHV